MTKRRGARGGLALVAMAVTVSLLGGCAPALGRPALRQGATAPTVHDNADPAVLVFGGRTYLFGSTNNMKLPVREVTTFDGTLAQSRQDWDRSPRDAMPTRPAWVDPAQWEIWAPTAIKLGEKYVVYFAARRVGPKSNTHNDQCIGRAEATSPMGPYTPGASPVYCGLPREGGQPPSNSWGRGALDPEIFRAADGKLYLLVALSRTRDNIGVLRLDSIGRVIGGVNAVPTTLVRQAHPWHDGTDDSSLRSDAFLENPSMVYDPHTRTYLLFYSAGQWATARYVTGFARCAAPTGPCTVDGRGPFLKWGAGRSAPGGLTAFRDAAGDLRVAYATWQSGREGQGGIGGEYARHTTWARLLLTATSDPAAQTVRLG